jgi:hypothetical protein
MGCFSTNCVLCSGPLSSPYHPYYTNEENAKYFKWLDHVRVVTEFPLKSTVTFNECHYIDKVDEDDTYGRIIFDSDNSKNVLINNNFINMDPVYGLCIAVHDSCLKICNYPSFKQLVPDTYSINNQQLKMFHCQFFLFEDALEDNMAWALCDPCAPGGAYIWKLRCLANKKRIQSWFSHLQSTPPKLSAFLNMTRSQLLKSIDSYRHQHLAKICHETSVSKYQLNLEPLLFNKNEDYISFFSKWKYFTIYSKIYKTNLPVTICQVIFLYIS